MRDAGFPHCCRCIFGRTSNSLRCYSFYPLGRRRCCGLCWRDEKLPMALCCAGECAAASDCVGRLKWLAGNEVLAAAMHFNQLRVWAAAAKRCPVHCCRRLCSTCLQQAGSHGVGHSPDATLRLRLRGRAPPSGLCAEHTRDQRLALLEQRHGDGGRRRVEGDASSGAAEQRPRPFLPHDRRQRMYRVAICGRRCSAAAAACSRRRGWPCCGSGRTAGSCSPALHLQPQLRQVQRVGDQRCGRACSAGCQDLKG